MNFDFAWIRDMAILSSHNGLYEVYTTFENRQNSMNLYILFQFLIL